MKKKKTAGMALFCSGQPPPGAGESQDAPPHIPGGEKGDRRGAGEPARPPPPSCGREETRPAGEKAREKSGCRKRPPAPRRFRSATSEVEDSTHRACRHTSRTGSRHRTG